MKIILIDNKKDLFGRDDPVKPDNDKKDRYPVVEYGCLQFKQETGRTARSTVPPETEEKNECIHRVKLKTFEEVHLLVGEYIQFYNNERIHSKTKLTPLEKRSQFAA